MRNRRKNTSHYQDAGTVEPLLGLGLEEAATHPGVLTNRASDWVHHVRVGGEVDVRVASGEALGALRERIDHYLAQIEPLQAPFSVTFPEKFDRSGDALKGLVSYAVSEAFEHDFGWVAGELTNMRPRRDKFRLRENALAGSTVPFKRVVFGTSCSCMPNSRVGG